MGEVERGASRPQSRVRHQNEDHRCRVDFESWPHRERCSGRAGRPDHRAGKEGGVLMNDLAPFQPGDRATGAAQFFSRVQRYKSLLKRRWWVLLLTLGIAVGAQTYRASKAPLTYVSKAQMIMGNRSPIADPNSAANEE